MGLKPSHLDSHMYTLGLRQDLLEIYQSLGKEFKLPILLSKKLISYTGENPNNFKIQFASSWQKERKAWNFNGNGK